jgi:hypothetical protein
MEDTLESASICKLGTLHYLETGAGGLPQGRAGTGPFKRQDRRVGSTQNAAGKRLDSRQIGRIGTAWPALSDALEKRVGQRSVGGHGRERQRMLLHELIEGLRLVFDVVQLIEVQQRSLADVRTQVAQDKGGR